MKKFIIAIIILTGLGGGVYYFIFKNKGNLPICEEGFKIDFQTKTCVPDIVSSQKTETDFSQIEITVPETNIKIKLTKDVVKDLYTGSYTDQSIPGSGGDVSLQTSQKVMFSEDKILIPLVINSGGTGNFVYVSLFDIKQNIYLGSIFIGDRIMIDSIIIQDQIAKVNYKTRASSEAYSAEATIPAQVVLEVQNDSLKERMRLQNSDYSEVEIKSPYSNSSVFGQLVLKGSVSGTWYFEGVTSFYVLDESLNKIAFGSVQALSDWTTTQRVPFELTLDTSTLNYKGKATVVIESENVQGGSEGERKVKRIEVPVVLK